MKTPLEPRTRPGGAPDPDRQGLAATEAARRLAADGPNTLPGGAAKSALAFVPRMLTEPTFLMLLKLLIDPACSVVFEAQPEAAGQMSRPPRALDDTTLSGRNLLHGAWQGGGLGAILRLGAESLRRSGGAGLRRGRRGAGAGRADADPGQPRTRT